MSDFVPPVGARGWATERVPSPPNGFPVDVAKASDDELLAVARDHLPDDLGHCERCGGEWVCAPRLRAVAQLRERGVERRPPEEWRPGGTVAEVRGRGQVG